MSARHTACRVFFCCFLVVLLAAGCLSNTPHVVKIGMIAPFEALYRNDGYAALAAVKLAVAQRNAAGGVAGNQVALVAVNDNGRGEEASQQAAYLAADPAVLGVVGLLSRSTALSAGPTLATQGLPWVSLASLDASERRGGWSVEASPAGLADAAAHRPLPDAVQQPWQVITGSVAAMPVSPVAWLWLADADVVARQIAALPAGSVVLGGPELGSSVFGARAGQIARQVHWLSAAPLAQAMPADFVAAYRTATGVDPTPQAALAYQASVLLLDALDKAGRLHQPLTRAAVAAQIRTYPDPVIYEHRWSLP